MEGEPELYPKQVSVGTSLFQKAVHLMSKYKVILILAAHVLRSSTTPCFIPETVFVPALSAR